jgi:hypothetical protein
MINAIKVLLQRQNVFLQLQSTLFKMVFTIGKIFSLEWHILEAGFTIQVPTGCQCRSQNGKRSLILGKWMRSEIVGSSGERPSANETVGRFSVFLASRISHSIWASQVRFVFCTF